MQGGLEEAADWGMKVTVRYKSENSGLRGVKEKSEGGPEACCLARKQNFWFWNKI